MGAAPVIGFGEKLLPETPPVTPIASACIRPPPTCLIPLPLLELAIAAHSSSWTSALPLRLMVWSSVGSSPIRQTGEPRRFWAALETRIVNDFSPNTPRNGDVIGNVTSP